MKTMNITPETLKEIIDCIDYSISQMETSQIAVLSTMSSDDCEEDFAAAVWSLNVTKNILETLTTGEGIITVSK